MPQQTVETYSNGQLVSTRQVEIPQEAVNADTLQQRASQALTANVTYLALANPTNAQNLAQIRALTRECNALIRLMLGALDDITGT